MITKWCDQVCKNPQDQGFTEVIQYQWCTCEAKGVSRMATKGLMMNPTISVCHLHRTASVGFWWFTFLRSIPVQ